jgi:oxygen-dependent protoporphyrinogen oxidase
MNVHEPNLSGHIAGIEHVSTAVVCLGLKRSQVKHPLNAFGCVIPAVENRKLLAISFTNVKFPARAPDDCVLIRAFTGGALQPELAALPDDELMETVLSDLGDLLGVSGTPISSVIVRWPRTTPQYHIGHLQRVAEIEASLESLPGFAIAGNAYRGVGMPQCIRSGWLAADRIATYLARDSV